MSCIHSITGTELTALISKPEPVLIWFDGTPGGSGYTFPGFDQIMQAFASQLRERVTTALLDVDEWSELALEYGVYGAPELALFRDGAEVARFPGKATLLELLLWISPHIAHSFG